MSKPGRFLPLVVLFLTAASCLAQSVMTHHVRDVVRNGKAQANGRLPNNQVLQLDLVLPLRDAAGLKAFLADLYNPASPNYRNFLTPTEFTARFGPTVEDYDTVLRFATTYGFEVVGGSRDGMEVQVKGSVANIEAAFHVNMRTYQHPSEARIFYSPDREPTMDLPFNLWHISGLDNYSIPKPMVVNKNDYAAAHGIQPDQVVSHATTGSGPSASFLGSDMRAAYYGGSLTGAGQNVGLLEYYGTNLTDLQNYYANVGQTYPGSKITIFSTDGTSTSCNYSRFFGCDDTEQTLDMTQALGMAPGMNSLVMYVGSTDTAIISAMTTHNPLPTTIGCSWGWTPADPSTLDPYFQKMAAQGQNFFAASGDSSTWSSSNEAWPADDAYVVSVGGTDLVTSGAAGPWASETAWVDSGGGISPDGIAIPSWQTAAINSSNKGSTTLRNGPDVSANANFTFYVCADQTTCTANSYGGTSFAAPMWAGFIALVNEQLANNAQKPIGFINPTIYSQNANASTYAANFHDITSGTSGSFSAVTGYDLVTGWGSPTAALVSALSGPPAAGVTLSATPSSQSVVQGSAASYSVTSTATNGFDASVSLSATGLPSGAQATFTPSSIAAPGTGTSSLSITTTGGSTPTPAGTYTITINASSGGNVIQSTTVTIIVTAPAPVYTLKATPTSIGIRRGSSGTVVISASVTSGSPTISLSASGQEKNVSVSFTPSSITGSTSSNMKITVNRKASVATFTINVTGSVNGAPPQTVPVSVSVQ